MKFFILFTILSLFAITCYAEETTFINTKPTEAANTENSEITVSTNLAKLQKVDKQINDQVYNNAIFYQKFYQIEQDLSQNDFATTIKKRFAATDHFYRGLNARQQQKIYAYYKNDPDFRKIRSEIFDLYFK